LSEDLVELDQDRERLALPVPSDSFKRYLAEIAKHPLLTRKEEKRLAELIFEYGDKDAAQKLVVSNLRLVVKIALGYYTAYSSIRDLIQEGNIGLIHAVRKYNPYKGTKFSTYASFWIRAYIMKYIRNTWSIVKVGTTEKERKLFHGLNKEKRRLEAKGILPARQLLAHNLDVSTEEVEEMEKRLSFADVSLDQPLFEDGEQTILDAMQTEHESIEEIVAAKEKETIARKKIAQFKRLLNEKELYIFEHRIMADEPLTLQEIGDHFSISRERARQIEKGVTTKVTKHLVDSKAEPERPRTSR
jgi:RNA polymerase sigma-32 factor